MRPTLTFLDALALDAQWAKLRPKRPPEDRSIPYIHLHTISKSWSDVPWSPFDVNSASSPASKLTQQGLVNARQERETWHGWSCFEQISIQTIMSDNILLSGHATRRFLSTKKRNSLPPWLLTRIQCFLTSTLDCRASWTPRTVTHCRHHHHQRYVLSSRQARRNHPNHHFKVV